jgi:hypothetical protein
MKTWTQTLTSPLREKGAGLLKVEYEKIEVTFEG